MRWLFLFPFYFFGAVSLLLLLLIACRVTRIPARLRVVANLAASGAALGVLVPVLTGWLTLADFTLVRMLALAGVSLLLAAADRVLARPLAHPLDAEMRQL